ncbi:MAG: VWA domain-containing protein [Acidobacteria bacterium]|nr:VWA domain-containing protein [Acidobacteriota bacterium]
MKRQSSLAVLLMLALIAPVCGQTPAPTPATTSAPQETQEDPQLGDEDVVRITTNLIQVDAVVTDRSGRPVTDLRPEEFEILENGQAKAITNFSYVTLGGAGGEESAPRPATAAADKNAPPVPPARLRPEQVRRTIALVVDDLGLSAESMPFVRRALKKFVDEQMQPGDLVAIVRTGGGAGALQQFTSDKRLLTVAIENLRWNQLGRGGLSAFAPLQGKNMADELAGEVPGGSGGGTGASDDLDEFRGEFFTVGTLGALSYIVQGLRELPGRKSVMLFSDGIILNNTENQSTSFANSSGVQSLETRNNRIMDSLSKLIEFANRASVVIYTMDVRGLQGLGLTAADNAQGLGRPTTRGGLVVNPLQESLLARRTQFYESQQGLNYLAQQTGGIAIRNNNDVSNGIKKMLDDQHGFYLIGYHPDEETFDPKRTRFNKLEIKVKRPGLSVRYRSGFFGVTDESLRTPAPKTRAEQLSHAIIAPFASGDLDVQLTSLFANDAQSGSFMRSLLHVDASKLTFTEEPDGWRKLVFDIMAVTFGENGDIVDQVSRTENVRLRGETYQLILRNGFNYIITVPIRKSGAYQLRTALRDSATERIGSASQFITVPDINKNRLTLSGLVVTGFDPDKQKGGASGAALQNSAAKVLTDPQSGPGVRKLRRGMVLQFDYIIYNARLNKLSPPQPQLNTQIRLFREGRQIFEGNVLPFNLGGQLDLKRLSAGGRLQLGSDMAPGEYVLQVIVTDQLVKGKSGTATQWIDFQITQ